jgi:DNA polymerase/3'-5' exonuclease PolX
MLQSELLQNLGFLRRKSKEKNSKASRFIDMAYDRVVSVMKGTYSPTTKLSQKMIETLPITENMKSKLIMLLDGSVINGLMLSENLSKLLGIGEKKAEELVKKGLTDIKQLKQTKWLNMLPPYARILVTHAPRTNFPRKIVEKLEPILTSYPWAEIILVGSYRRQVLYCNDIDIMLISDDYELKDYIRYLDSRLKIIVYNGGRDRVSFLIKIGKFYYKADVFRAPKSEKYAALIYATGSRELNIKMRAMAKKKGYLLNQHGLFKGDMLVPQKITSERNLFDKLGIKYLQPHER